MPTLHKIVTPKLYEQALAQIEALIDSGEWKPGCKIPSEAQLKEKLGVSAAVLRETFRVLESRNLVISKQGQGRFLRQVRPEFSQHEHLVRVLCSSALLDIIEVRRSLERTALEIVINRATDDVINQLEAETRVEGDYRQKWEQYVDISMDFHVCVARATRNPLLEALISSLIASLRELRQRYLIGFDAWIPLHKQHMEIMAAIRARDLATAQSALDSHLDGTKDVLVEKGGASITESIR